MAVALQIIPTAKDSARALEQKIRSRMRELRAVYHGQAGSIGVPNTLDQLVEAAAMASLIALDDLQDIVDFAIDPNLGTLIGRSVTDGGYITFSEAGHALDSATANYQDEQRESMAEMADDRTNYLDRTSSAPGLAPQAQASLIEGLFSLGSMFGNAMG